MSDIPSYDDLLHELGDENRKLQKRFAEAEKLADELIATPDDCYSNAFSDAPDYVRIPRQIGMKLKSTLCGEAEEE